MNLRHRKLCPLCGKRCYNNKWDGHAAIARIPLDATYYLLSVYRCAIGNIHIGRNRRMYEPFRKGTAHCGPVV